MINEDCGCGGHKEEPNIKDMIVLALSKAIKQKSMNEEQATNFIREVIKKIGNKYVLFPSHDLSPFVKLFICIYRSLLSLCCRS